MSKNVDTSIDDMVSSELSNHPDPKINEFNNKIQKKTIELYKEKEPLKKYQLQTELDTLHRDKMYYTFKKYVHKFIFYIFLLILFTLNLISVAVSLSVNRNKSIVFKLISGIYAFCFSILYIFINYRYFKLEVKKEINTICSNNPFIF
jgi:lipopolysaccharide export LptBFGC system permease protein LptF